MNTEHMHSGNEEKTHHGQNKPAVGQPRGPGRLRGQRNALYALAAELKARHPGVAVATAWRHFVMLAGAHPVLVEYDPSRGLCYVPDAGRVAVRWISRVNFTRAWNRLGVDYQPMKSVASSIRLRLAPKRPLARR